MSGRLIEIPTKYLQKRSIDCYRYTKLFSVENDNGYVLCLFSCLCFKLPFFLNSFPLYESVIFCSFRHCVNILNMPSFVLRRRLLEMGHIWVAILFL